MDLPCIAMLLNQLQPITLFGPSHEAWLPHNLAAHRRTLGHMPNFHVLHAWKLLYPIGDPSRGPLKALVNLRWHQARVIV